MKFNVFNVPPIFFVLKSKKLKMEGLAGSGNELPAMARISKHMWLIFIYF
jgi:hypothetical protein